MQKLKIHFECSRNCNWNAIDEKISDNFMHKRWNILKLKAFGMRIKIFLNMGLQILEKYQ